jgi:predicted O-methyltransferase YrrM
MPDPIDIVAPAVTSYLAAGRTARDPLLARLEREAEEESWPIIDRAAADLLEVLVAAVKPERALEIGTAIGYSGIVIARALASWANLETIEIDPKTADRAARNFSEAGLSGRVKVHKGDALAVIRKLENRYDFVFLDAAKTMYEEALRMILPLMPKGSMVVVDNLLWSGRVVGAPAPGEARAEDTAAIRKFNEAFLKNPALRATIVPVGDGLGVAVRV